MAKFLCHYPITKQTFVLTGELRAGLLQEKGPFVPGIILDKDTIWNGQLMRAGAVVLLDPRAYIVAEMYNPQDHIDDFTEEEFSDWVREHPDYPKYQLR